MIADEMRIIFRAERGEKILKAEQYRGRVLIATTDRILEWNPDKEEVQVLEIGCYPNENPDMVAVYYRAHPYFDM